YRALGRARAPGRRSHRRLCTLSQVACRQNPGRLGAPGRAQGRQQRPMMLTRCPGCSTTFRVTPEQVKARQGKVRCGRCQHVFDAIEALVEAAIVPGTATTPTPIPDAAPAVAPTPAPEPSIAARAEP